jgi:hypothetical protein
MNPEQIKKDWESRGYSFGVFKDPPGQVWVDFVHRTDELVLLAEWEGLQGRILNYDYIYIIKKNNFS